jgi:hypothetical protein
VAVHFPVHETNDGLATKTSPGGHDKMLSQSSSSSTAEVAGRWAMPASPPAVRTALPLDCLATAFGFARAEVAPAPARPESARARWISSGAARSKLKASATAMMRADALMVSGCA